MLDKYTIKQGDFFIFSIESEYIGKYQKEPMQVMELWKETMVVKSEKGCFSKPYSHFTKVTDISKYHKFHYSEYFENNLI